MLLSYYGILVNMKEKINEKTLSYLAGLFDGEGCIFIAVNKPNPKFQTKSPQHWLGVVIGNTYLPLITWLKDNFSGHILKSDRFKVRHKPYWEWKLASNQAKNFLMLIYPYLRIKREQAKLAIEFQTERERLPNYPDRKGLSQEIIDRRDWYKKQISEANGLNQRPFKPTIL